MAPTRFTCSRGTRNGWRYSVFALAMCSTMLNSFSMYGREARIRSWAFFIFEAATISIALVILRVLCTLLILFRISFEPAIVALFGLVRFRVFLKSSIAAPSAFSSSAVRSHRRRDLVHDLRILAVFMNWRSAASNASAFSTGTSS